MVHEVRDLIFAKGKAAEKIMITMEWRTRQIGDFIPATEWIKSVGYVMEVGQTKEEIVLYLDGLSDVDPRARMALVCLFHPNTTLNIYWDDIGLVLV